MVNNRQGCFFTNTYRIAKLKRDHPAVAERLCNATSLEPLSG